MKNGLVMNAAVETLVSGQDLIVDGDNEMQFGGGDEGVAVISILDLVKTQSASSTKRRRRRSRLHQREDRQSLLCSPSPSRLGH